MKWARVLLAFGVAGIFLPKETMAQFEPTPNILVPNYDRAIVGEVPALEAGTFVARAKDASANWYNPAGLAQAERTSINTSASAYQWTSITGIGASGVNVGQTTSGSVPDFFGVVVGPPIFTDPHIRMGFALVRELDWNPVLQEQVSTPSSGGSSSRISYAVNNSFGISIPAFSIGIALSDSFRIGFGAGTTSTSYLANNTLSSQQLGSSSQSNETNTYQINASTLDVFASTGIQYDLTERWRLGLLLRSPNVGILGGGQVNYENLTNEGGQTTDTAFYDAAAIFRYKIPFQAFLGLAYVGTKFEFEGDLRFHAAVAPYTILSSKQNIVTNTSSGGGATTMTNQDFPDVVNSFKSVLDYAVGTRVQVGERVNLHAGLYTSYSPVKDASSPSFRKIDLYGTTFGASVAWDHFSGSLGAAYEFGTSDSFTLPSAVNTTAVDTKIKITSLKILYSLTFGF